MSITSLAQPLSLVIVSSGVNVPTHRSRSPIVFEATSDATTNTGFKYLFKLEEDGTEIHKAYVTANPSSRGFFDISPLIRNRVELPSRLNSNSVHQQSGSTFYFKVEGAAHIYDVIPGEVYESSGTLTEFPDTGDTKTVLVYYGANKLFERERVTGIDYLDLRDFCAHPLGAPRKVFLTRIEEETFQHLPETQKALSLTSSDIAVPSTNWNVGGLAWIHDDIYFGQDNITSVEVKYYDEDGSQVSGTLNLPIASLGGQAIDSTDSAGKIMSLHTHIGSHRNSGWSVPAGAEYISFQLRNDGGFYVSKKFVYYRYEGDCRFNKYQLAWDNGIGFYDYYTFNLKAELEDRAEKKNYSTNIGTWSGTTYRQYTEEANTRAYQVNQEKKWKLSTGKVPEEVAEYLKHILTARKIDLIDENGTILPVTLEDTNFTYNKEMSNTMKEYTFTVKLAQYIEA